MSEFNLSPDARQCLWRCYSLLLKLADQAEKEAAGSELDSNYDPTAVNEAQELPHLSSDTVEEGPIQVDLEKQGSRVTQEAQIHGEAVETP
ncbi:hypothetical protein ACFLXQ_04715 [Chloroflexota bacterium]